MNICALLCQQHSQGFVLYSDYDECMRAASLCSVLTSFRSMKREDKDVWSL